ncbi:MULTISPECIES: polysaccharide biosynthesis/export family protein [Sphingomonas]|uniref:polysaccharide biosynthesis/export family protein n=1 Tax=Sphingomonas TaxID=13687 RepID=UPI0013E0B22D|nr:polysaccharide biosynthesis/export family protein [Sphingomonas sp. ABOLF]GLK19297.1 hypothetical protein GCM10017606_01230 [Microbacterium terregens]
MRAAVMLGSCSALILSSGCATKSPIKEGTASAVTPVSQLQVPDPRQAIGEVSDAYYIGPQDQLDIAVYQLPELTRQVRVDAAGKIALPFVGEIKASGMTTAEISNLIASRLRAKYMQRPEVTVGITEAISQRITLEGAVTRPGMYPIPGKVTLLQALALAGGTNNIANERLVAVFRNVGAERQAAVFDVQMIRRGEVEDPTLYGNDLVVVERSRGKVLLRDVIGTLPVLNAFRTVNNIAN